MNTSKHMAMTWPIHACLYHLKLQSDRAVAKRGFIRHFLLAQLPRAKVSAFPDVVNPNGAALVLEVDGMNVALRDSLTDAMEEHIGN